MTQRVLIIGSGSIAIRHQRIISKYFPSIEIGSISSRGGKVKTPENIEHKFDDFSQALKFKPTITIICSPAPFHVEHAIMFASVGSHLIIEKPVATSTEQIDNLRKHLQRSRVHIAIGYNLRFLPSLIRFRSAVLQGAIGKIYSVNARVGQYLPTWRPKSDYRFSVSAREELGGGVLYELSHELDYLHWIFGQFSWVTSWVGKSSDLDINVADNALIIFETETKVIGQLNLDFIRRDTARSCEAVGEMGTLKWDGIAQKVEMYDAKCSEWVTLFDKNVDSDLSYINQFKEFMVRVEQCDYDTDMRLLSENTHTLKIINAIQTAHNEGCRRMIS